MKLTVFTPAYNRAGTLPRLYESLLKQSCFDFEWLIIDDGSTDNTAAVVKTFTGEGKFPVRYIYKENGGKHTAHNRALEEAAGDWFLCVDSDDLLTPCAVEEIVCAAEKLPKNTGIAAYKQELHGGLLSDKFPEKLQYEKTYRLSLVHGCNGEFTYAFPTEFAKRYPFPVFSGERFIGECVVYDRMDQGGQMLLLDKVITLCEYQIDGYSGNFAALVKSNPSGYCLYFLQRIDLQVRLLPRIVHAGKYWCFRWISGNRELIYQGKHKLLVALSTLPGVLFRVYYKLFRGI